MISDLSFLCLSCGEIRFCHTQGVELVQRFEPTQHLPGLDTIAETDVPLSNTPGDSEPERRRVERLDTAGHHHGNSGLGFLHGCGPNWPRLWLPDLFLFFAGG